MKVRGNRYNISQLFWFEAKRINVATFYDEINTNFEIVNVIDRNEYDVYRRGEGKKTKNNYEQNNGEKRITMTRRTMMKSKNK